MTPGTSIEDCMSACSAAGAQCINAKYEPGYPSGFKCYMFNYAPELFQYNIPNYAYLVKRPPGTQSTTLSTSTTTATTSTTSPP